MRRLAFGLVAVAAVVLGVASQPVAFGWDRPLRWVPDLVVGLTFVGVGLLAWQQRRGAGTLLVLTGFAWFAGNLLPFALFWHRGPLVHALVAYPRWRPGSRVGLAAVAIGYAAAAGGWWRDNLAGTGLTLALVGVVALGYARSAGPARHYRRVALWATVAVAAVLVAGAVTRLVGPGAEAVLPALLAYQAVLCAVAVGLAVTAFRTPPAAMTDLVVELGSDRSDTLRGELARLLGDRGLQVGYWSPRTASYLDAAGEAVPLPEPGGNRVATPLTWGEEQLAVLVHDRAVLDDPGLVEAVQAATRLSESHARLRSEVAAQLAALSASRRRLLVAADQQRRELEQRLHEGPRRRLARLREELPAEPTSGSSHVARAIEQLAGTLADLDELARGLHPRELTAGLPVALAGLAERSPVPVRLTVSSGRYPPEVEVAAWYACTEALTNAAKHASATSVAIQVDQVAQRLVVTVVDDGRGGADQSAGSGLRGLADRLEALGGRLTVDSPDGGGTRLVAAVPLGDQPT